MNGLIAEMHSAAEPVESAECRVESSECRVERIAMG
jgi:hypothetical protein